MDTYLQQYKKFRKYGIDTKIAISDLEELQNTFCKPQKRSSNHKYRSNNWLKMHGEPMRRKPFKMELCYIIDEVHERFF